MEEAEQEQIPEEFKEGSPEEEIPEEESEEEESSPFYKHWLFWLSAILIAFIIVFAIMGFASGTTTCSLSTVSSSQIQGQSATSQSMSCTNSNNQTIVNILKNGNFYDLSPIAIQPNTTTSILITFLSSAPNGNNLGSISFSDGSSSIPVLLTVNSTAQTGCQINPSIVSYSQAIQQGTKTNLPSITFNPTECTGSLSLSASSVSIQGGIITSEGQKPISIASVTPTSVNLNIDTTGLATQQTYVSNLNINAFNKQFYIPFNIVVTSGTSPIGNATAENTPTCSLSSNILNLNTSYNLVCTNIQPDVTIIPEADTDFIVGTGLETSASQYIWKFKPVKFGTSEIRAKFFYRNAPIGIPFKQEVKISSSGQSIPGTVLSVLFTPSLSEAKAGEDVIIQLIDNKSGSLITGDPEIYIDARKINISNGAYNFKLLSDKTYNFRGRASGYDDLIMDIKLQSKPLNVTITPENPDSATPVSITSTEPNVTIYIDGSKVNTPFSSALAEGSHEIMVIKEGFFDYTANITVNRSLSATLTTTFKKGTPQIIYLNKNSSWMVTYQKDVADSGSLVSNGTGEVVQFTPKKTGIYTVFGDNQVAGTYEIKSNGFFKNGDFLGLKWYWWGGGVVALLLLITWVRSRSSAESSTPFAPNLR